ncbi:protein ACCELERATED CELL DEATH 6-like [Apium graveolens]|uniref:protein ACCELERATED CELL DEATH 6-like n=1 Tax=Apium graveolens TaxID=4045 RepID=UPI003D79F6B8
MDSTLYNAVINDDINVLQEMEGMLNLSDQRTPTNNTVLHLACQYGSIKFVEQILRVPESLLLEINSRGETALHLAAREGHYKVVAALINAAKSLILQPNCLQTLIRTTNFELETALHAAVRYNHNDVVKLLCTEDPSQSQPENNRKETPLYLASIRRCTDVMKTILDNCESPSFGGPDGRTALHAAVLDDSESECLKILLDRNKDLVKVADKYGWTAFHYVAYYDYDTLVESLVRADRSVAYLADKKYSRTALHVAAYKGSVGVMKELLKYFPDLVDILDMSGRNVLHIAVEKGQKDVIRFICSRGFKAINNLFIQKDIRDGNTPLHLIAMLGCYVEEVMDLKALDWEVLNNRDETPLDLLRISNIKPDQFLQETGINKVMIEETLIKANVKQHKYLRSTQKEPDIEMGEWENTVKTLTSVMVTEFNKVLSTHMILAALIATVALTAGFSMPGGFNGNEGPTQGSPILLRKAAFRTFIVTDAVALLSSISSLFLYFMTTIDRHGLLLENLVHISALLNVVSVTSMMLAFITGTYAVLAHSSALAITVCVISSLFFYLLMSVFSYLLLFNGNIYLFFTILALQPLKLPLASTAGACKKYLKSLKMRMTLTKSTENKSESIV